MFKRLVPFHLLILFLAIGVLSLLGLSQANAEILLTDDFEDATRSNTIWTFKNPSAFGVVLDQSKSHSGKGVLELRYEPGTNGPGFEVGSLPRTAQEVYVRWYDKYSANWKWSGIGQKILFIQPPEGTPYFYVGTEWGSGVPEVIIKGEAYDPGDIEQNIGSPVAMENGRWYCLEIYARQDLGTGDGAVKMWIDGELKLDRSKLHFTDLNRPLREVVLTAYYNSGGDTPTGVPQLQYRWIDDVAASTERIGCLPDTGDKTPPAAPKGLRITNP
jgi:hypothetical protein